MPGFVAGPENRLAQVAVASLLNADPTPYSPLVLYGPSGTGKSHLATGLLAAWKNSYPRLPAVLVTAPDFARDLAEAIESKAVDQFNESYRRASLLVVEDLQHLLDKSAAQQELLGILDALGDGDARVVVTCRVAPVLMEGLLPGLQSRLVAGLTIPLALPGLEARCAALKRFADARCLDVDHGVLRLLAEGLPVTIQELDGALAQLQISAQLEGTPINALAVRSFLAARITREPSLRAIAAATARHFSLRIKELRSSTRRRAVVTARGVAMYLARSLTGHSLDDIGRYFGGRDHTTVSHGCRKTEELASAEPSILAAIVALQERLKP